MSRRLCYALDLIDDAALIAKYEAMHEPGAVWPNVVADIIASGVEDMEIWRTGTRLFMVATVCDNFPRAITASIETEKWEALMWTFQQALPHSPAGEKWAEMDRIFDLSKNLLSE